MKKLISMLLVVLTLSCTLVCYASEYIASKQFVDSNTFTYLGKASKENYSSYATVRITDIYDANMKISNYSRVYTQIRCYNSIAASAKIIQKGVWTDITIEPQFRSSGNVLQYYCMGNNSSLDCYITGTFISH